MSPAEALKFLHRKLELVIENTWTEENEQQLRAKWEPVLQQAAEQGRTLKDFKKIDRDLDKAFNRFLFDEDRDELRERLVQEFGLSRLATKAVVGAELGLTGGVTVASEQRYTVSAEEIARASASMPVEVFWKIMGRAAGDENQDGVVDVGAVADALVKLSGPKILGFAIRLEECMAAAYRWDVWAVAYIVRGGCSDDSFTYFRAWLIGQGREYFEAALRDPERAADRAEGRGDCECEELLYVAQQVYEATRGKALPRFTLPDQPKTPSGRDWREEELPEMFPRLAERFS